jgi:hypothetical protein
MNLGDDSGYEVCHETGRLMDIIVQAKSEFIIIWDVLQSAGGQLNLDITLTGFPYVGNIRLQDLLKTLGTVRGIHVSDSRKTGSIEIY